MIADSKDQLTKVRFRVVAVSATTNSFGLHGHVLMTETGETWQVGRNRGSHNDPQWNKGDDIEIFALLNDGYPILQWHRHSVEIPRKLDRAPAGVIAEVFATKKSHGTKRKKR